MLSTIERYLKRPLQKMQVLKKLFVFIAIVYGGWCTYSKNSTNLTQFVDPNIGTAHCRWFHYTPGAVAIWHGQTCPFYQWVLRQCAWLGGHRVRYAGIRSHRRVSSIFTSSGRRSCICTDHRINCKPAPGKLEQSG